MSEKPIRYATRSMTRIEAIRSLKSWFRGEKARLDTLYDGAIAELKKRGETMAESEFREFEDIIRGVRLDRFVLEAGLKYSSLLALEREVGGKTPRGKIPPGIRVQTHSGINATGLQLRDVAWYAAATNRSGKKDRVITGDAIVYNLESCDLGGFRETIAPGAATKALKTSDIRALVNHNADQLIGRVRSGTLRLKDTPFALQFSCVLPDSDVGRRVYENIKRRDMSGCSFSFTTARDTWRPAQTPGGMDERTVLEVQELFDICPTTYPAYPDTHVAVVKN